MKQLPLSCFSMTLPIQCRQLESLIRLSQARAKVELRESVTGKDAEEVRLSWGRGFEHKFLLRFHSFDDGFCSALPGDRNHARIFVRCSHRRVWNGGLQVFPCYLDVFAARGIDQSMTKYYSDFCMHICSRNSGMSKAKAVKCFIAALNKVLRGCWTTPHNLGHYDTWT